MFDDELDRITAARVGAGQGRPRLDMTYRDVLLIVLVVQPDVMALDHEVVHMSGSGIDLASNW